MQAWGFCVLDGLTWRMGPSKGEREAGLQSQLEDNLHLICMWTGGVKLKAGKAPSSPLGGGSWCYVSTKILSPGRDLSIPEGPYSPTSLRLGPTICDWDARTKAPSLSESSSPAKSHLSGPASDLGQLCQHRPKSREGRAC